MSNIHTGDGKEVSECDVFDKNEQTEDGKMGKNHGKKMVEPEMAQPEVSEMEGAQEIETQAPDVETQTTVAVAKTQANVDYIIGRLKATLDFDKIVKDLMDLKPKYKSTKNGDKILLRQVKNIYKFTEEGDPRFAGEKGHKLVVDKETGFLRELTQEELDAKKLTA
jgi:hypothetical protein